MARQVGAEFASGDNFEVIDRPEVDAVIVSRSEPERSVRQGHRDAISMAGPYFSAKYQTYASWG